MDRITDNNYESIIYISHPYNGNEYNERMIKEIIVGLYKKYPNYLFISPVHAFDFLYKEVPYKQGIQMCLWLLEKCDEMWVFGDWANSKGCNMEIEYCKKYNIPYKHVDTYKELDTNLDKGFKYIKKNHEPLLLSEINTLNECLNIKDVKYFILEEDRFIDLVFEDRFNNDDFYDKVEDIVCKIEEKYDCAVTISFESEVFVSEIHKRSSKAILYI